MGWRSSTGVVREWSVLIEAFGDGGYAATPPSYLDFVVSHHGSTKQKCARLLEIQKMRHCLSHVRMREGLSIYFLG